MAMAATNPEPGAQAQQPTQPPPAPDFFPFHVVPGVSNFRDVGGWPIQSPNGVCIGHVRKSLLYRGSDTTRIKPEGVEVLRALNIQTDYDLRSREQIQKLGGYKEMDGIQRVWKPVFSDEQYSEEAARMRYELYAADGTDGIVSAFMEILTCGGPMFRDVLLKIIETVARPPAETPGFFMHCTTGNNRTGVFIALLLLLLRVPPDSICDEYTLSDQGLAPTRHTNVKRLLAKGAFREYGDEAQARCERMVSARRESMAALIEEVQRRWDGPDGYFQKELGFDAGQIEAVREVFTVRLED